MRRIKRIESVLVARIGGAIALWSAVACFTMPGQLAQAAERVVLRYGPLQRSLTVQELSEFARTGEVSPSLQSYLNRTQSNPEDLRRLLNRQAEVHGAMLDRLLRTPLGDLALDRVSRGIHTRSRRADRQAMRSALTLSATDDNRISLIEVLENYPTREVYLDGEEISNTVQEISKLQQQIRRIGDLLEQLPGF